MAKEKTECDEVGCTNPMNAKGMCKIHYNRFLRANKKEEHYVVKPVEEFDYEDYWNFVKKELNLA